MASSREIAVDRRNGGCGVIFEDRLYIWGGETVDKVRPYENASDDSDDEEDDEPGEEDEEIEVIERKTTLPRPNDPNHPFDVLDINTLTWSRQPTSGDVPSLGLGSVLNVHPESHSFYLCTGWNERRFDSEVYRVSVHDWNWDIVQPATDIKPSPRYLTGICLHGNRLVMFGGVGPQIRLNQDPGARYILYTESTINMGFGWNNEYYEFDIDSSCWEAPLGHDAHRPEPMAAHSFSKVDQHRALLFGGRTCVKRVNEMFLFDLDNRVFSGPIKPSRPNQPWPLGRTFASLTPLVDPEKVEQKLCGWGPVLKQKVLLLWGKNTEHTICDETWLLDLESCTWTQLNINTKPRAWHVACPVYSHVCTECHVVVFGGNMHTEDFPGFGVRESITKLKMLIFGLKSLVKLCLAVIVMSEQLVAGLPSLPPKLQSQIRNAHTVHENGPPSPAIASIIL